MVMESELLKIIFDYSKSGKILDYNAMEMIINIVVISNNLDDYVKSVNIDYDNLETNRYYDGFGCLMDYNFNVKKINIYDKSIKKIINECQIFNFYDGEKKIYNINLYLLQVLLHEIEHAKHNRIYNENSMSDNITKLFKIVYKYSIESIKKIYDEFLSKGFSISDVDKYFILLRDMEDRFYEISPCERIADIDSYKEILKILNEESSMCNLYSLYYYKYHLCYLRGYSVDKKGNVISPTIKYVKNIYSNDVDKFSDIKPNDFDEAIYLGFPIDTDKFDKLYDKTLRMSYKLF